MEREYACNFIIYMPMEDGETEEDARIRIYDQLFDGICNNADHPMDFQQFEGEVVE